MTQSTIVMVSALIALLATSLVILAKLVVDNIAAERKMDQLHETIMSGNVEHLYHMLNRLENDGTIKAYEPARHELVH